ncbi:MAG: hypothetical protein ABR543_15450, partial [Gemmatimonadaceae bacterium]
EVGGRGVCYQGSKMLGWSVKQSTHRVRQLFRRVRADLALAYRAAQRLWYELEYEVGDGI